MQVPGRENLVFAAPIIARKNQLIRPEFVAGGENGSRRQPLYHFFPFRRFKNEVDLVYSFPAVSG
jgi:hypothetical protein